MIILILKLYLPSVQNVFLRQPGNMLKKANKTKIESSDLLWAITTEPTSLAMQALEQLGADVVEIREGIKKHTQVQ